MISQEDESYYPPNDTLYHLLNSVGGDLSKGHTLWYIKSMKWTETFFWYDLETFGLNSRYDRIAQFAGVRTDSHLQVIEEPVILYCKLSDDYLPDPLACAVTGITPQEVQEKGLNEQDFIAQINALLSEPGTCAVGYNTIRFDDEFIRNALFRNFFDPYQREYGEGRSRWDILDLVRAAHDLRPNRIVWPVKVDSGRPSFKLTDLTEANGISHEQAHDAMSDVWATLELARLIKFRQPKLFSYYLGLRDKQQVKRKLTTPFGAPVIYTAAEFTRTEGCSTIVIPITMGSRNNNTIFVFDLRHDPSLLISASQAFGELEAIRETEQQLRTIAKRGRKALQNNTDLAESLKETTEALTEAADLLANLPRVASASERLLRVPGLHRVAINKSPFISPMSIVNDDPDILSRLGIDIDLCEQHRKQLIEHPVVAAHIGKAADIAEYAEVEDVDLSIYLRFFNNADAQRFAEIRSATPEELWLRRFNFDDPRAYEMLWRYLCRNWPESLDDEQRARWKSFCAQRLLDPPGNTIVNLQFFARKVTERMESKDTAPKEKQVMANLEQWGRALCERIGIPYPS